MPSVTQMAFIINDGKILDSWKNAKSKISTLQGTNGPWQKERVVYFNKFSFLQVQTIDRQILQRQSTILYSAAYRQSTIHLQCSLPTKYYSSTVQAKKIFNDKTLFSYSTMDKFFYFQQKQKQLSKADNQLSR